MNLSCYSVYHVCKCSFIFFFVFNMANPFELRFLKRLNKQEKFLRKSRSKRDADETFAKDYLQKYGYVQPNSLRSDGRVSARRSWRKAVLEMQTFFNLKPTGELDTETLALMQKPRCANADKVPINTLTRRKKRYVNVGSKWQSHKVTYSINNHTPKLGKKLTHEAIDNAFAVWSKHIPLEFKKVSVHENPDIVTFFAEGFHNDNTAFDGVGGYLAHAYYPGPGIGGDTHFDGAEPWTLHEDAYEGNDLFLVAVHELGHALGLGHSPNAKAIMAPVYKYHDTNNFVLPKDDILGIQSIYGKRNDIPKVPLVPTTTVKPKTKSTTKFYPFRTKIYLGKSTKPSVRPTKPTPSEPPIRNICEIEKFDAISFIRHQLYVFSGHYVWRRIVKENQFIMEGPYKITSFWADLTEGVNAAFENPNTNQIFFFKDHLYWEYNGVDLQETSPRAVRFLGLQNDHVGAAVWWERNGKSYFFQGSHYWRFSGSKVERDYPKPISVWKGIPKYVDAAFTGVDADGQNYTYFVKGTKYWKFNNWEIKVVSAEQSFRKDWLKCGYIPEKSFAPSSKNETSSTIIAAVLSIGAICLVVAILYVIWKRTKRPKKPRLQTSVVNSPIASYMPGFSEVASRRGVLRKKPMCVTAAQQRIRWFRFSLQEKV